MSNAPRVRCLFLFSYYLLAHFIILFALWAMQIIEKERTASQELPHFLFYHHLFILYLVWWMMIKRKSCGSSWIRELSERKEALIRFTFLSGSISDS